MMNTAQVLVFKPLETRALSVSPELPKESKTLPSSDSRILQLLHDGNNY